MARLSAGGGELGTQLGTHVVGVRERARRGALLIAALLVLAAVLAFAPRAGAFGYWTNVNHGSIIGANAAGVAVDALGSPGDASGCIYAFTLGCSRGITTQRLKSKKPATSEL